MTTLAAAIDVPRNRSPSEAGGPALSSRAAELLCGYLDRTYRQTDRLFVVLMALQYVAGIWLALFLSPRTWDGVQASTHPHVWAALVFGTVVVVPPIWLAIRRPGETITRHAIAFAQMIQSGLLIQFTGGRIETHFHVFGSLAFLGFYRDWRVLITASVVTIADHVLRGFWWPFSVYGTVTATTWRSLEHAWWVFFADVFTVRMCLRSVRNMADTATRTAELEQAQTELAALLEERTRQFADREAQLKALLDRAVDGLLLIDERGTVTYLNPAGLRLLGFDHDEVSGRPMDAIFGAEGAATAMKRMRWATETGVSSEPVSIELVAQRRDGSAVDVDFNGGPIDSADRPTYIACIRDNSGRKAAERKALANARQLERLNEELRVATREAQSANRAKSEFLANMSHEIRTPMTAILGFADLLAQPDLSHREQIDAVNTIRRNGEHLLAVINDILDLSRIERGGLTIVPARHSPVVIVSEVASMMRMRLAEKKLDFKVEFVGDIPETIETDALRLRQVLINIVGNAIKFTHAGGVRLVTRWPHETPGLIQFDVIDSGVGMTDEQVQLLFHPFTQADASIARRFGGTGLGLFIARKLAASLGGDVVVAYSVPNSGTCVRTTVQTGDLAGVPLRDGRNLCVTIAACDTPPPPAGLVAGAVGDRPGLNGSLPPCRILLAEDGLDNQRLIVRLLERAGATVTVAADGRQAVQQTLGAAASGQPFDVVLMDIQMPELDGSAATRHLRRRGYSGPIIALTAHVLVGERERCLADGFDAYVSKPVHRTELFQAIQTALKVQPACAG
jgi:two-component system sensor histidine kinase/response regulator